MPSTSTVRSIEAQPKQHSNRCNATVLKQNVAKCFIPFQSDKLNSGKGLSMAHYVTRPDMLYKEAKINRLIYQWNQGKKEKRKVLFISLLLLGVIV